MLLPKPKTGESQADFMSRCMECVYKEQPDATGDQASALAYSAWRESRLEEAKSKLVVPKRGEKQFEFISRCTIDLTKKYPTLEPADATAACFTSWRDRYESMHPVDAMIANGVPESSIDYDLYHEPALHEGNEEVSRLVEAVSFEGAEFIEEDGVKIVRGVAMLGSHSSHGYDYKQEAMSNAVKGGLYEGVRIFINHAKGGRSPMELAGVFRNSRHESQKVRGDAHLLPNECGDLFWNIAKTMPEAASCSHVADGKLVQRGTRKYVESITRVHSVDLVVQGATTKTVFEGQSPEGESTMDLKDLKLEDLRAARPEIIRAVQTEGKLSRDDEVQALISEKQGIEGKNQELQLRIEELELAETVRQKESIVGKVIAELPEHARTDTLKKICMDVKSGKDGFNATIFEADVTTLVKGIKQACEATGVRNMGGDRTVSESSEGGTTVDEKAADKALTL